MTTTLRPWLWFALVTAVILAAAGWMGATVWAQDAREQRNAALALWEQKVQAALWRMDSAAAAIVAREAARKPEEVAKLAREDTRKEAEKKERRPGARYFSEAEAKVASAEKPAAPAASFAARRDESSTRTKASSSPKADDAMAKTAAAHVATAAPSPSPAPPAVAAYKLPNAEGEPLGGKAAEAQIKAQVDNSYAQRAIANQAISSNYAGEALGEETAKDFGGGTLAASVADGDIVLSRRIADRRHELVQGLRLGTEAVERELLPLVLGDFPKAQLRPEPDPQAHSARTLAAMPLRFFPGEEPVLAVGWSPVRTALVGAGGAFALALGAVALLLARTLDLAERRAEFVATMTHELRTPLTTFRLYTDLLEAAPQTEHRARYTQVLAREAERLAHLVENVLAYTRLEHGKKKPPAQSMTLEALLVSMRERLCERAERAGLALEIALPDDAVATVHANVATVEQILLNLVDNAGKYAAEAKDKRLILEAQNTTLSLRDFGPGLDPVMRKRLFTPFSRSDKEAAGNAPGVGLGLALCRRLAREMGGDLRHEDADPGARFILELAD